MDELPTEKEGKRSVNCSLYPISTKSTETNTPSPTISQPQNKLTLNKIMTNGQCTKYPILVFICVCTSFLTEGVEMNLMNLCIIPIKTYYNLSFFQIKAITAILFLGVTFGCISSGWLSKQMGSVYSSSC